MKPIRKTAKKLSIEKWKFNCKNYKIKFQHLFYSDEWYDSVFQKWIIAKTSKIRLKYAKECLQIIKDWKI